MAAWGLSCLVRTCLSCNVHSAGTSSRSTLASCSLPDQRQPRALSPHVLFDERFLARPLRTAPRSLLLLWPSATRALSKHVCSALRPTSSLRSLAFSELSLSAFSSPSFGRVQSAPPSAAPLRNRQRRKVPFYRTVTHVGVSEKTILMLSHGSGSRGRLGRETSPRLHPSRGECRYTVLVGWRVPFVVCVGEVASSRA